MFKIKNSTSQSFNVDWTDLTKLARNAGIVGGSAALAYFISHLSSVNLGEYTVVLVPIISVVADLAYRWFKDNTPE